MELPGHSHPGHHPARQVGQHPLDALSSAVRRNNCEEPYLLGSLPIFGAISLGLIPRSRMSRSEDTYCGHAHLSQLAQPPAVCWKDKWFQLEAWSFLTDSSCRNGGTPEAHTM